MLLLSSCCGDYLHNSLFTEVEVNEIVPSILGKYLYPFVGDLVGVCVFKINPKL